MSKLPKNIILLTSVADVIKYFSGEIPDLETFRQTRYRDDLRVKDETFLRAIELMELAKHLS